MTDLVLNEYAPWVLPPQWSVRDWTLPVTGQACKVYAGPAGLQVLLTIDDHPDGGGRWLHASASHRDRLSSWADLKSVHRIVLGDRPTVQLFPPRAHWLSVHEHTLHLFARLDAPTVPETLWRRD